MIVPSKNQKIYGVIHTENYFSFLGFCKKVNSDKIQKVDIFLNDTLIDTIVADKHIEKIEAIYELEGFGFDYVLPHEYIGQKNLISFKNHETKEDLQNSPYELIDETHPKFNEARFLNSLENPINDENFKDIYCSNTIGFLLTEENLKDEKFIEYIKMLITKFPNNKFKGFYYNENNKVLAKTIFPNNLLFSIPKNIYDIAENCEFLLTNHDEIRSKLSCNLVKYSKTIFLLNFNNNQNLNNTKLIDFEPMTENSIAYKLLLNLNIQEKVIITNKYNFQISLWKTFFTQNSINYKFDENITYIDFMIDLLNLSIKNKEVKNYYTKAMKQLFYTYGWME